MCPVTKGQTAGVRGAVSDCVATGSSAVPLRWDLSSKGPTKCCKAKKYSTVRT